MTRSSSRFRWFFKFAIWAASLFAVGVLFLWGRSVWFCGDILSYGSSTEGSYVQIVSSRATVILRRGYYRESGRDYTSSVKGVAQGWGWKRRPIAMGGFFPRFDCFYESHHRPAKGGIGASDIGYSSLTIPNWSLVAAALAVIGFSTWRLVRGRVKPGFCATCGYDLRTSVGRCPECGAPITEPAPAQ